MLSKVLKKRKKEPPQIAERDIFQIIFEEENLIYSSSNIKNKDKKIVKKIWQKFLKKEQKKIPPIKIPPIRIVNRGGAKRFSRKTHILAFGSILAAIILLSVNQLLQRIETGPVQIVFKSITTQKYIKAGTKLLDENTKINILKGAVTIKSVFNEKTNAKSYILKSNNFSGHFNFLAKTDFTIEHPKVTIKIVGTRFLAQLEPARGNIHLFNGTLSITYRPPKGEVKTILLEKESKFTFDKEGTFKIENLTNAKTNKEAISSVKPKKDSKNNQVQKKQKKATIDKFLENSTIDNNLKKESNKHESNKKSSPLDTEFFELKNGQQIYGIVLSSSDNAIFIQTLEGKKIKILKNTLIKRGSLDNL